MNLTAEERTLLDAWKKKYARNTEENLSVGLLFWADGIEQTTKRYPYFQIPTTNTISFEEDGRVYVSTELYGKNLMTMRFETRDVFLEWDKESYVEVYITKNVIEISLDLGKVLERTRYSYSLVVYINKLGRKPDSISENNSWTIKTCDTLPDLYGAIKKVRNL